MSSTDALPQFSAVEDILTQATFHLKIGKHSFDVDVSICREKLTYRSVNGAKLKGESIAFTDIVGCRSIGGGVGQQSSTDSGDGVPRKKELNHKLKLSEKSACLQIFAYKYNKNPNAGGVRRRVELNFVTDEFETQKENASLVEKWRLIILALLQGVEFSSVDDLTESLIPPPPHYLVCINPFSGKEKAVQLFKEQAKPIFEEAGITFKEIITERRGHGTEIAMNLDLKEYNGVIIVSGDGLFYEFINGFGQRRDREEAFKMPLGILPGGSGNALCSAVLVNRGEQVLKNMACHAAVAIVKGKVNPKDMVQIQTQNETVLSFLSVAWGILADIDIESERFRFLGATRFQAQAVQRIMFLRKNPGRLSFLPIKDESKYHHLWGAEDKKRDSSSGISIQESQQIETNIGAKMGDSRSSSANQNANASSSEEGTSNAMGEVHADDLAMPSLSDPVPPNWTVIQGDFVCVLITIVSHISNDFMSHPGRSMDEGIIMVQYMDETTTRWKLINTFDKYMTGEYLKQDFVKARVVKAFRLEPLNTKEGILTVDGEQVKFGPIQGMLTPSKCHCII
ncbi:sphingosine kinase 2 [Strongylocentrotus purpuratus]|uniref:DAGKc domain-containing protein n=1 Tax=Strongylocentrotus purpuratus TaxID=7668 RepID=A0A7M7LPL8_STRPU|nr:sphingosine kinase 2 [Strongylocentrotus purpuratus]